MWGLWFRVTWEPGLIGARTAASADWGPVRGVGEVEGAPGTQPELWGGGVELLGCQHGVAGVRQRRQLQQRTVPSSRWEGLLCL